MSKTNIYRSLTLAIFLEILALVLTIGANKDKKIFTLNSLNHIVSQAYRAIFKVQNYLYLKHENQQLIESNKKLLQKALNCRKLNDTVYNLIFAEVIKNSVDNPNNLMVISAGSNQGVEAGDAVVSVNGNAVGTVIAVSQNYASVLSILNQFTSLSVLHKKTNTLAELVWEDISSPRFMIINNIPIYIPVHKGDTIITSGYSQIFPKGLVVGTVYSISKSKISYAYRIKVLLSEDFRRLQHVFVIKNKSKSEIVQVIEKANKILSLNE